ncbi:MAG: penicillin-binding protein 1C [Scytolyngbya sp. HA4215-MV1]|nr:penicillin-binding protein 1C [Scytolyngbya sp. HA4215-MV1]
MWHGLRWWWRSLVVALILALVVRSLPYLAPIRAVDLVQDQQAIELSDRNGLLLGTLLTRDQEHTAAVPLQQVSPQFIQAIVAAEDGRFYQHGAVDLRAIVRSALEAMRSRRILSGASTITMQLARMIDPIPRTISGKLREIWTAWRLVAGMSRDEVLQAYINRLPMGGNIYGVEAAARTYFAIPASDLNLAQASLLAALPNDPVYLNPYDRWQPLKERQAYVLERMVKDKHIAPAQAEQAYREAVTLQPRQQGIVAAPHFLFWVASQLPQGHPAKVRTTIDLPLQQFVETQVTQVLRSLASHNVHHAAALVIDSHSGEVLAYVGSPNYFTEATGGRNDGVQALRQPGSTLKPFLYQLALENRVIHPNTVLADVPTHYAISTEQTYSPQDYSETFQGPVRVRLALANSLNVPAVRVLEKVGVAAFLDRLHQLGFAHLTQPPEYYGLGLTLGSGEVSLWELARAYGVMAKRGEVFELTGVKLAGVRSREIGDRRQELHSATPAYPTLASSRLKPDPDTWSLIVDMLSDRHARARAFGVHSILDLPFATAVKTGTSSQFRDTWAIGFSSDYIVATWVGNFDGESMRQVSGVTGAAPLWSRILLHLHEQQDPAPFPQPSGMVKRPVCALSGLKPTPACPSVVQEYFYPQDLADYERQPDTFYQLLAPARAGQPPRYRLNLPREYDEWLAMQQTSGDAELANAKNVESLSGLRIVAPRNGDQFLLDPVDAGANAPQKLEFKLVGCSGQAVEWWLNGQKLVGTSGGSLFWSMRPGNWTLEVKCGEQRDRVQFQVQIAESGTSDRRGFSVSPDQ